MTALVSCESSSAPGAREAWQMWDQTRFEAMAASNQREFHEVWTGNLNEEFNALLVAVSTAGGTDAIIALDMEFPGFLCKEPRFAPHAIRYQALRSNVNQLWPIQLGLAVMAADGTHRGVWTFNLSFDAGVDAHTEESLVFLLEAGIDFPRHRTEGINAIALGRHLSTSRLVGAHGLAACWLTFSGSYDWGYLLKLLTLGQALPETSGAFERQLSIHCPKRQDLRDLLPNGSLEALGRKHGVKRWGSAHTAGSDALLTSELFVHLGAHKHQVDSVANLGEMDQHNEWDEIRWDELASEWSAGSDHWYFNDFWVLGGADTQAGSSNWNTWDGQSQATGTSSNWLASHAVPLKPAVWHPRRSQPWYAAL